MQANLDQEVSDRQAADNALDNAKLDPTSHSCRGQSIRQRLGPTRRVWRSSWERLRRGSQGRPSTPRLARRSGQGGTISGDLVLEGKLQRGAGFSGSLLPEVGPDEPVRPTTMRVTVILKKRIQKSIQRLRSGSVLAKTSGSVLVNTETNC